MARPGRVLLARSWPEMRAAACAPSRHRKAPLDCSAVQVISRAIRDLRLPSRWDVGEMLVPKRPVSGNVGLDRSVVSGGDGREGLSPSGDHPDAGACIGRLLGPSNPGGRRRFRSDRVSASGDRFQEDCMSEAMRVWLASLNAAELAVFGAVLLGVFIIYLGTAMATALFHRDRARRLLALEIFRDLLDVISRRSR
jgi:hypothetical protein